MKKPRKTVTKAEIIEAINTENLDRGSFVKGGNSLPGCEVCAVGAVLRSSGLNNEQITSFGEKMMHEGAVSHEDGTTIVALADKKWLHALSIKFEMLASQHGTGKRTRSLLTKFVEKYFPNRIELNPKR